MNYLLCMLIVIFSALQLTNGLYYRQYYHRKKYYKKPKVPTPKLTCQDIHINIGEKDDEVRQVVLGAGRIYTLKVKNIISGTCRMGYEYGFLGAEVWCKTACDATFEVCYVEGKKAEITCRSKNAEYTECEVDSSKKILTIFPVRQYTYNPCFINFSYGSVDGNPAKIWVDHDCEAKFCVTYTGEVVVTA